MIDFKSINAAALPCLGDLLPRWLPGGRAEAGEYVCASLEGGQGRSCSVNLDTGAWGDFATDAKGGDPISLWAAIRGIKQGEAARELARVLGLEVDRPAKNSRRRVIAAYDYLGADGKLIFQVTRWEPKTFTQRRPDGNGGWIPSVKGIELVPYRLPSVIQAKAVFIVEGEKDAEALAALGLAATCNAQGAGKWRVEYNRHFAGKRVCMGANRERFEKELRRLSAYELKAVVVEASMRDVADGLYRSEMKPHAVLQSVLTFQVRYAVPCRVDETEDAAQARYVAETGATIGPRDMVVALQRFGDGRGRLKRTQQGDIARCPNLAERMKAAILRGKARREAQESSHGRACKIAWSASWSVWATRTTCGPASRR